MALSRRQVLRSGAATAAWGVGGPLSASAATTTTRAAALGIGAAPQASSTGAARSVAGTAAVGRLAEPFALAHVALGPGIFQRKRDRILNFARNYPGEGGVLAGPDRLLHLFREQAGLPTPDGSTHPGGWDTPNHLLRGHYTGHFMTLLAQAHAATGEDIFTTKLDHMVAELAKCQQANDAQLLRSLGHPGYLSAFGEDHYIKLEPPLFRSNSGPQEIAVWAPWYTFHKITRGLVDAHVLTGNDQALDIAFRMGEWAHSRLSGISRSDLDRMWNIYSAGETGGANEVMADLAMLTDDPARREKYLVTAKCFDFSAMFDATLAGEDILDGRHANTFVPPNSGYVRIFEATGDADYLTAARNFWGMVVPHRIFSNGGTSGPGEFFNERGVIGAHLRQGSSTYNETCTAYNMLKLTRNLFLHDPAPGYMDYYEQALFNQILGSKRDVDSDAGPWVTYHQNLFPGASRGLDWTRYVGADGNGSCCTGTGLENHTKYQESIWFRSPDQSTLWVNLFIASTLSWPERGMVLTQSTEYPQSGAVRLTLTEGGGALDLQVRIPAWAHGTAVRVNGVGHAGPVIPGTYLGISRTWTAGDTVEVDIPMRFRTEATPDDRQVQAVFRGPSLMVSQGEEASLSAASNRQPWRELPVHRHRTLDGFIDRAFSETSTAEGHTAEGFEFVPFHVADPQIPRRYHAYFLQVDDTIAFGSHDSGVADMARGDGLTFLDVLWEGAPFDSHARFEDAVQKVCDEFASAGLLSPAGVAAVVTAAAAAREELEAGAAA